MASVLPTQKLARMIPNATSFINDGYNPITFSSDIDKKEKKQILKLLKKLGKTFETEESKLEAFAIVSAMLPTYFWFQWREMENIALETGLAEKEAQKAVSSSLKKAWKLYYKSGLNAEEVMDLIPVKPIGENEAEIKNILNTKLIGLFEKIKPWKCNQRDIRLMELSLMNNDHWFLFNYLIFLRCLKNTGFWYFWFLLS